MSKIYVCDHVEKELNQAHLQINKVRQTVSATIRGSFRIKNKHSKGVIISKLGLGSIRDNKAKLL